MRAPLAVRINDGVTDRHVTDAVRGLSFRKTAPGGFASMSMRLLLPRSTFSDLGPADPVWVYGPTGKTVCQGFTENPGTMDGPDGQGFDLSCMGTTVLASDESRALMYVDKDLGHWGPNRSNASAASSQAQQGADPAGSAPEGLLCAFIPGQPISTNSQAEIYYKGLVGNGASSMLFGGLVATMKAGKVDTGYRQHMVYYDGAFGTSGMGPGTQIQTTPNTNTRFAGDAGAPTVSTNMVSLRLIRTGGATNIADDATWSLFYDVSIVGQRVDRNGTALTGTSGVVSASYVLASWVAEDLLGRVLSFADKGLSRVDTTTWQIDQLAYLDGAKASQVLDDLGLWEPDFLWEILHSTSAGYVFNYRAWPTTARYEISVEDGYNAPGADVDLCNRIAVFWTDEKGDRRSTVRGASVPALGNGSPVLADGSRDPAYTGRVRDADPITLPDGQGSLTNAQRIGDQILAAKANPPKAATAVVKRPIVDMLTGAMAYPWEIEPGYLVRVRENGDLLRLTEMGYDDDTVSANLTLGQPQLSEQQRIARLENKVA